VYRENIVIAIHHHIENSYSKRWIEYCEENRIKYKLVDCYNNNIIEDLKSCDALMWHWSHLDYKAQLFARGFIYALEMKGFLVFPNAMGSIYFDDKMGQKYILESIDAPLVNSYVFYDKSSAIEWIDKTSFPKIFKLSSGAGAYNVKMIRSKKEAKKYIKRAFGKGFLAMERYSALKDRIWHFKRDKTLKSFFDISRGLYRYFLPNQESIDLPIEKNYIYAQDFIADCDFDMRIFVIGDRAMSKKRFVRKGDFRASGSGKHSWSIDSIHKQCVKISFDIADKLKMPSVAFDLIIDKGEAKIIEICYASSIDSFRGCKGYWNRDLEWIKSEVITEDFMMEDMIYLLEQKKSNRS
jgi:glutathione synthase/RimK-type ligase-like ATP-grasp enzyme